MTTATYQIVEDSEPQPGRRFWQYYSGAFFHEIMNRVSVEHALTLISRI